MMKRQEPTVSATRSASIAPGVSVSLGYVAGWFLAPKFSQPLLVFGT